MTEETEEQTQEVREETEATPEAKESREERRARHDFLRFKHESKELKSQNEQLQAQLESLKEQSLVEKQNYKQLYENEKTKTEQLAEENRKVQSTFFGSLKNQELQKEAMRLGIREEALADLNLLDTSAVITETTSSGSVNILGATEFMEQIKQTRPYWFKQQGAPVINNGNPEFVKKEFSASDLLELQKTNPEKYKEEIFKRMRR